MLTKLLKRNLIVEEYKKKLKKYSDFIKIQIIQVNQNHVII